jgi:NitT/TauT family transport system permease protein
MSSDLKLLQMADVYRMGHWRKFLHIRVPSALPFFVSGAGASLGLTWKVVVAGEILSSPRAGIGTAMQTAKVQLETARVFSLTLTAIFLSILTELVFDAFVHLSRRHSGKEEHS